MYLGKKHGLGLQKAVLFYNVLAGDSEDDLIKIMVAEGGIKDVRQGISKIALSPDYVGLLNNVSFFHLQEKLRPGFMPLFFKGLEFISKFLGDKKYLMGDKVC